MTQAPADLVERLYTAPPEGFVAVRDEAVARARAAGDPGSAREIAKLRKPTVAAWLVNLLAIRRPDLVAGLADLAAALRAAQRDLRGPRLRELSARRRDVINVLVGQARELAHEADPQSTVGKLPLGEVEATLNAALADAALAEQVRSGRLVRAATYTGFGEAPRPQLRLVTDAVEEPDRTRRSASKKGGGRGKADRAEADRIRRAEKTARAAQRRALATELTKARTQEKRAESQLERAVAAERDGARALADVEAAVAEVERRRRDAEEEATRRTVARKAAERAAAAARRRTGEVQAAVESFDAEHGSA